LDTILFLLLFATLLAMRQRRRWLVLVLFLSSLVLTLVVFRYHVTSELPLNF
jgi:hypothetical protein